jgi:hypothetical protein
MACNRRDSHELSWGSVRRIRLVYPRGRRRRALGVGLGVNAVIMLCHQFQCKCLSRYYATVHVAHTDATNAKSRPERDGSLEGNVDGLVDDVGTDGEGCHAPRVAVVDLLEVTLLLLGALTALLALLT